MTYPRHRKENSWWTLKGRLAGWLLGATGLAAALLIGSLALGSPTARANHIPGATYTGTVSPAGSVSGGTVEFKVSADGSQVMDFTFSITVQAPPGGCPATVGQQDFLSRPIIDHAFTGGDFSGSFPSPGAASGTIQVTDPVGTCTYPQVTWQASTTAPPPAATATTAPPAPAATATTAAQPAATARPAAALPSTGGGPTGAGSHVAFWGLIAAASVFGLATTGLAVIRRRRA